MKFKKERRNMIELAAVTGLKGKGRRTSAEIPVYCI
jgi:hypothetical protein